MSAIMFYVCLCVFTDVQFSFVAFLCAIFWDIVA